MRRITLSGICAIAFALPLFASAESVLWNTNLPATLCSVLSSGTCAKAPQPAAYANTFPSITPIFYVDLIARVEYHVRATNADTGAIIQKSTTVPVGAKVKFEFVPHAYQDIYWVGTGSVYDSPYGDWVAGAQKPPGGLFQRKNYPNRYESAGDVSSTWRNLYRVLYTSLSVAPPAKTIAGLPSGCTTASDGVSKICTLIQEGTVDAVFNFAGTNGRFWIGKAILPLVQGTVEFDIAACDWCYEFNLPMEKTVQYDGRSVIYWSTDTANVSSTPYTLAVPAQSVDYPLIVTKRQGSAPSTPTLSSAASCIVGTPHTITMSATDPDGDAIRYGVDWNANGSIDEYVPPSGYVRSGTSQNATRTYATAGAKTVKVLAQDEGGQSSGWATLSFDCEDIPPPENCPLGYRLQAGECVFDACPTGYEFLNGECVRINHCTLPPICSDARRVLNQCTGAVTDCVAVNGPGWFCSGGICRPPSPPTASLSAVPSLVPPGRTSTITWSSENTSSCSVTGNGNSWNALSGSEASNPINARTEPRRVCRRLQILRDWSHGESQDVPEVLGRGA